MQFVADILDLPRRAVRLVAGASSRRKTLEIDGRSEDEIRARLQ